MSEHHQQSFNNPDGNQPFDREIERDVKIKPIDPAMPDFLPFVSEAQLEQLQELDPKERRIVKAFMLGTSVSDQRVKWLTEHVIRHNASLRELEAERVRHRRALFGNVSAVVMAGICAMAGAMGAWLGPRLLAKLAEALVR